MPPVLEKNIRWNNLRKEMVLSVIGKITLLILILVVYMVMMTLKAQGHHDHKGTGHGSLSHINIKRSDGTMVRIDIDG